MKKQQKMNFKEISDMELKKIYGGKKTYGIKIGTGGSKKHLQQCLISFFTKC